MMGVTKIGAVSAALICSAGMVSANTCAHGKTIQDDVLTIATGNPAYTPWVLNDDPESGEGFEAAFAWALAQRMGFDETAVKWVRTTFDGAIQPGYKEFDFNLQQFSITPERDQVVDFSDPYYTAGKALVVRKDVAEKISEVTPEVIRSLKFGGAGGQVSAKYIFDVVKPAQDVFLFDDMADVTAAMKANQVEAAVFDVPTALFVTAVLYPNGVILGQFAEDGESSDSQFGLLFAEGNPLRECANEALASMKADGTLQEIETKWMNSETGISLINMAD